MSSYEKIDLSKFPIPDCSKALGCEQLEYSLEKLELRAIFNISASFTNPQGNIQGGFVCALLDDVMGPALVFSLPDTQFAPTLELKTQFLKGAVPGHIEGIGRVLSKGKQVCYVEGELFQDGQLVAKATATALIRDIKK